MIGISKAIYVCAAILSMSEARSFSKPRNLAKGQTSYDSADFEYVAVPGVQPAAVRGSKRKGVTEIIEDYEAEVKSGKKAVHNVPLSGSKGGKKGAYGGKGGKGGTSGYSEKSGKRGKKSGVTHSPTQLSAPSKLSESITIHALKSRISTDILFTSQPSCHALQRG